MKHALSFLVPTTLWFILTFLLFLPVAFAETASGLVPCGGTGQQPCQACHVIDLTNNVIGWLVIILGTVAAIIIIYAGAKLVTANGNQRAMEDAKSMINNMIIGYVIVLAGWLLVDTVLKAVLNEGQYGVWNQVQCVDQPVAVYNEYTPVYSNPSEALSGTGNWITQPVGGGGGSSGTMQSACDAIGVNSDGSLAYDCSAQAAECAQVTGSVTISPDGSTVICSPATGGTVDLDGLGQCHPSNGACSVSVLMAAGLTAEEANVMSCIAMTESSGIASTPPYNVTHPGSNSSACGTFQIVRTTWNGNATGACADFSNCMNAACNIEVMTALVDANGYSDWTCAGCNNKASGCIVKYGN